MKAQKKPEVLDPGMADRIRRRMADLGLNHEDVESAVGVHKGYVSRILSGARGKRITPEILRAMADVLGTTSEYLRWGHTPPPGHLQTQAAGLQRRLDQIDGYRDAELEVARLEPKIPLEVFETVRSARLWPTPHRVTVDFVRDLVKVAMKHRPLLSEK